MTISFPENVKDGRYEAFMLMLDTIWTKRKHIQTFNEIHNSPKFSIPETENKDTMYFFSFFDFPDTYLELRLNSYLSSLSNYPAVPIVTLMMFYDIDKDSIQHFKQFMRERCFYKEMFPETDLISDKELLKILDSSGKCLL